VLQIKSGAVVAVAGGGSRRVLATDICGKLSHFSDGRRWGPPPRRWVT